MLQLYTAKDNRTGPQTIELLTRRIVNLGAVQAGQVSPLIGQYSQDLALWLLIGQNSPYLWLLIG